ncbi:hypothetical protein L1887_19755 [Cichorium endivia]|nr:hypothetical protein L1887_19755 [Cichorium endivia]
MFKGAKNYLRMKTDPTASEVANKLINSNLKEIGDATKKFANHVIQLGVSGGFITTSLQWFACFAAIYLLILDRTNWRTNMLTALLATSQRDQGDEGERRGGAREAVAHTSLSSLLRRHDLLVPRRPSRGAPSPRTSAARWPLIDAMICASYSSDWSLSSVVEDQKWNLNVSLSFHLI